MTKLELKELLKNDMLEAMRQRDKTDPQAYPEYAGYYQGQFRAFESILRLLSMFDIDELSSGDIRTIIQ